MAQQGFYLDPPGRKMAWHDDGTIVLVGLNTTGMSTVSSTNKALINGIDSTIPRFDWGDFVNSQHWTAWRFPDMRRITHYHSAGYGHGHDAYYTPGRIQVSVDTTNGMDGTWTTPVSTHNNTRSPGPVGSRKDIWAFPDVGFIRGVRFEVIGSWIYSDGFSLRYHFYGEKSVALNPHRVIICDSNGVELGKDFDYGDRPADLEYTWDTQQTFNQDSGMYLKNTSPEKEANNVRISFGGTTGTIMSTDMRVSRDNYSFTQTLTIPKIHTGEVYGPFWIRRLGSADPTSIKAAAMKVEVERWSHPEYKIMSDTMGTHITA